MPEARRSLYWNEMPLSSHASGNAAAGMARRQLIPTTHLRWLPTGKIIASTSIPKFLLRKP